MSKKTELLTVEQMMERYKVAKITVYRWARNRKYAVRKKGRRWFFIEEVLA